MLEILRQHRDLLKAWQPYEPVTRHLQLLVEAAAGLSPTGSDGHEVVKGVANLWRGKKITKKAQNGRGCETKWEIPSCYRWRMYGPAARRKTTHF